MNCEQVDELSGAYALGILDAEERAAVEEHLRGCALHPELASLRAAALLVGRSVEEREPPPGMRARVLAAAANARPTTATPVQRFPQARPRWVLAAAAAAVLVVIFGGLMASGVVGRPSEALVRRVPAGTAAGSTLHYDLGVTSATLEVTGLPPLPSGQTYQVWTIHPGAAPHGAGLFSSKPDGSARLRIGAAAPLQAGDVIAVTVEPSGGSPAPTTTPLFLITL